MDYDARDQQSKLEFAFSIILEALGDDPDREGLRETPKRAARAYMEMFEGMKYTNEQIAKMFSKSFTVENTDDLVIVKDIPIFSFCEHHIALMYDMTVAVGYIPNGKVIGLSKIARIAEMVGKRLQLQEKIGHDIKEVMKIAIGTENVMVVIQGKHSCMTARGIKSNSSTLTSSLSGAFAEDKELRKEFYSLL